MPPKNKQSDPVGRQGITRKAPSDQEGLKRRGRNRVAMRLLCSLMAAAKATLFLNGGAGESKYAFGMKLPLQPRPHYTISRVRIHCTTSPPVNCLSFVSEISFVYCRQVTVNAPTHNWKSGRYIHTFGIIAWQK